jgi:TMEM175 potassium channel family protein
MQFEPPTHENLKGTARLEAFSDGVFAIAITLLVLNLQVPHVESNSAKWALASALLHQWPSYLGFVTSFFTVLIMWMNHHAIFKFVHKVNARILFANGILLLITTAIPFVTGLLSEYLSLPEAKTACAVYTGSFVLVSVAYNYLWRVVIRDRSLLKTDISEAALQKITKNYSLGFPLYLSAFAASFVSIYLAMGICTALWIFWSVTVKDL